ncbi:methyltransferase domain-containing protein [Quadrisphaera setariae]|uniref:methyltransferase domain-containing protein n=1 Tax=Quadrisphaera setariae TaxID=2593304 RepID=UPI00165028BB|nr:class I SAM-dependent methyltransferase [Quadrisphaera setariae]
MSDGATPTLTEWLALREGADERARRSATPQLLHHLGLDTTAAPQGRLRVVDVGAGTGANLRHLAPVLSSAQDWLLLDHDPEVLERAEELLDEEPVAARATVTTRLGDLAGVDLRGSADLLTCTALLDVLRADQVDGLVAALAAARVPALMALTVTGEVQLDPPHPADAELARTFDDHQQRDGRLGPLAAGHTVQALARAGFSVLTVPTPWRLGPEEPELVLEWAAGRVEAAVEQDPALAGTGRSWLQQRSREVDRGELHAVVHHVDLAAGPPAGATS